MRASGLILLSLIPLLLFGADKQTRRVYVVPPYLFHELIDFEKDVAAILRRPVSGLSVSLRGRLLSKIKHERYLFTDGTGVIPVYIRDLYMPMTGIPIQKEVEIDAVVRVDVQGYPELHVSRISFVNPYETTRRRVTRFRVPQQPTPDTKGKPYKDYYYRHYPDRYP